MDTASIVAIDLAKSVFQLHGATEAWDSGLSQDAAARPTH